MQAPDAAVAAKYLINTHMLVKVIAFHPETQTVDVVQEVYDFVNTTDGSFVVVNEYGVEVPANVKELDVFYGIPVKQERYGQFSVQVCPKEGDTGYLEIFTEDIQDWVENGGPSVPWATLRFLRKNSVFVPFVPNAQNAITDYPTTNESFVIKSAHTTIKITDPEEGDESLEVSMRNGVSFKISADGTVSVNCQNTTISASGAVTIDTPSTTITGTLNVDGAVTTNSTITSGGSITSGGDVVTSTGVTLDTHIHPVTNAVPADPLLPVVTSVPTP